MSSTDLPRRGVALAGARAHQLLLVHVAAPRLAAARGRCLGLSLHAQAVRVDRAQRAQRAHLRYSSHTARSGLGLARVVRLSEWPRHANGMVSTTPLDPCACEMSAQGGD